MVKVDNFEGHVTDINTRYTVIRALNGRDPAPAALQAGFGADGLEQQVSFWIADPENGQANVRSDVNLALLRTLDALGVRIPFPQRVPHRVGAAR